MKFMPLIVILSVFAATLPAAQVAGYGRDGTRIYPDATPPTTWAAKDVRWEAPLPSWGTGSPIVVAGKVFAMCEPCPGHDFPFLVRLDAATGRQLWLKEVDHLAVTGLSEQDQAQVRQDWHDWLEDFYARSRMRARYHHGKEDKPALEAEMKAKGWSYDKRWRMVSSDDKRFGGAMGQQGMMKQLHEKAGLTVNVSQHLSDFGLNAVGLAYGTPASDGEHIYVNTAFGSVASFDFDGKQRWIAWVKGPYNTEGCIMGRSPILWDDPNGGPNLVLTDIGGMVRAIDRKTGAVAWSAPIEGQDWSIVSPGILTVGGRDILWAAACNAFLLPEGRRLTVVGWGGREGMQTLVKHDEPDVAFFCGAGEHCGWPDKGKGDPPNPPAAVRFALDGETLKAEVLWDGGTIATINGLDAKRAEDVAGGNAPWMLCHENRFYHRSGAILDALAGRIVAGAIDQAAQRRGGGAVPKSGHLLCVAGGHVYGLDSSGKNKGGGAPDLAGTCEVFTVDGKKVAANPVPYRGLTPEQQDMWVACSGRPELVGFGVGNTFTFAGGDIFFRSFTSIICIGAGQ